MTEKLLDAVPTNRVLDEVMRERERQHAKWGEQNYPMGTGGFLLYEFMDAGASLAKENCDVAFQEKRGTFAHILWEEFTEVMEEDDPAKLRAELIQLAAVAVQMVEAIDREVK